ncbi:hypothetical protein FRB94_003037 [Tulasnella sp. JGI-2019a]|nr:hypothetical protein FRB94_003037 [Tulasnella sp. JGI-2019a]
MKTMLTTIQLWVLNDIVEILRIPYLAQEVLSSEHTPTLSIALPTYKLMLSGWWNLEKKFPNLKPAIQARLSKIEDYVAKARKSKIYTLEIDINLPGLKGSGEPRPNKHEILLKQWYA